MQYLNLLSLIVVAFVIIYVIYMNGRPETIRKYILKLQLLPVLLYNIVLHIVLWGKIPVEFSTVNYFVVPIIVLFNIKKLEIWAVYAAMMAGFFYFFSMIIDGTDIYGDFPAYAVYFAIFNHASLMSFAFIKLSNSDFSHTKRIIIWTGLLLCIGWALLLKPYVHQPGRIFIYEILDTTLIPNRLGVSNLVWYSIYYVGLAAFLEVSSHVVYWLNAVLHLKRSPFKYK